MIDPTVHQISAEESARQDLASNERSLVGQIRRAVADSLIGPEKLAADIGVDVAAFVGFQAGDCELPVEALDKLFRRLNLTLVRKPETKM